MDVSIKIGPAEKEPADGEAVPLEYFIISFLFDLSSFSSPFDGLFAAAVDVGVTATRSAATSSSSTQRGGKRRRGISFALFSILTRTIILHPRILETKLREETFPLSSQQQHS